MTRALICGITGQDGAYLARHLLGKGYEVVGTSRDADRARLRGTGVASALPQVPIHSMVPTDFRSVLQTLAQVKPDQVYNLAGQSSVALSFEQPVETLQSVTLGTLNLLESIRFLRAPIRFYNACSGECYGECGDEPANEETPFRPLSPYAIAKAAAFWMVANYRDAYGLFACSGILFNHESPLRPTRFVTQKVVSAACRIAAGADDVLNLGDLTVARDWGWASEYVEAMVRMLAADAPRDYVIATGETYPLEDFVAAIFGELGLNWRQYVCSDPALRRPSEHRVGRADPSRALRELGWKAKSTMPEVARLMVAAATESTVKKD